MIAIVDYGVGNLRSVERALLHVGATPKLTADQDELQHADGMVLPGVGAFAPALEKLYVKSSASSDDPVRNVSDLDSC